LNALLGHQNNNIIFVSINSPTFEKKKNRSLTMKVPSMDQLIIKPIINVACVINKNKNIDTKVL